MEGTGLNIIMCRKVERSALVALDWMSLQTRFCRLLIVQAGGGGCGARGFFQRTLVLLCFSVMIILPSLIILTFYLEKITVQYLSQIYLIDIRELVLRLLRMWPCCTCSEKWGKRSSATVYVRFM